MPHWEEAIKRIECTPPVPISKFLLCWKGYKQHRTFWDLTQSWVSFCASARILSLGDVHSGAASGVPAGEQTYHFSWASRVHAFKNMFCIRRTCWKHCCVRICVLWSPFERSGLQDSISWSDWKDLAGAKRSRQVSHRPNALIEL